MFILYSIYFYVFFLVLYVHVCACGGVSVGACLCEWMSVRMYVVLCVCRLNCHSSGAIHSVSATVLPGAHRGV